MTTHTPRVPERGFNVWKLCIRLVITIRGPKRSQRSPMAHTQDLRSLTDDDTYSQGSGGSSPRGSKAWKLCIRLVVIHRLQFSKITSGTYFPKRKRWHPVGYVGTVVQGHERHTLPQSSRVSARMRQSEAPSREGGAWHVAGSSACSVPGSMIQ